MMLGHGDCRQVALCDVALEIREGLAMMRGGLDGEGGKKSGQQRSGWQGRMKMEGRR
jgi:hypothetical protein